MHRIENLMSQIVPNNAPKAVGCSVVSTSASNGMNLGKIGEHRDDDIVIVCAVRTAITKARKGGFKDTPVEELLAAPLKAVIDKTKIDPKLVGDIIVGSVLGPNVQRANESRMAAFLAGYPDSVPVHLINRQCSSGIQVSALMRNIPFMQSYTFIHVSPPYPYLSIPL